MAAYASLPAATESGYTDKLRDAAARDREAELWVAVGDEDEVLGTVTVATTARPGVRSAAATRASSGCWRSRPPRRARASARRWCELCIDRFREVGAPGIVLSTLHADVGRRTGSTSGTASSALPSATGRRSPGVDLVAYHLDLAAMSGTRATA